MVLGCNSKPRNATNGTSSDPMELTTLPPAANLYLLQQEKANLADLLRTTFLDLVARDYLKTTETADKQNQVQLGTRRNGGDLHVFETLLLSPFEKDPTRILPFKSYIQLIKNKAVTASHFTNLIFKEPAFKPYVTPRNWLTGKRKLTPLGVAAQTGIKQEVTVLESTINSSNLGDFTRKYGGHILLTGVAAALFYEEFRTVRQTTDGSGDYMYYSSALYDSGSEKEDHNHDSWDDNGSDNASSDDGTSSGDSGSDSGSDSGGDSGGCGGGCGGGGD